jgi:hypothetical protein
LSRLIQQRARTNIEWLRQLIDDPDCRIALASLDIADICPVDTGAVGIIFLGPAFALAQTTDVSTKALSNVHIDDVPPSSTINLQTMSNN